MGGYGSIPDKAITSFGPEAYEMLQNGLNFFFQTDSKVQKY
jgi:hypothetical protein